VTGLSVDGLLRVSGGFVGVYPSVSTAIKETLKAVAGAAARDPYADERCGEGHAGEPGKDKQ